MMHNGDSAMPGATDCVKEIHKAGKSLIILSNTSAPSENALRKLPKLGFDRNLFVGAVTSGDEASRFIKLTYGSSTVPSSVLFFTWDATDPKNPRLTVLPDQFLEACGHVRVASNVDEADFVLFHGSEVWYRSAAQQEPLGGFIDTCSFDMIDPILLRCVERRLPAVCANPDYVVQTPSGGKAYMPGHIAERYQRMGGKCVIFGKPHREHFEACIERLGLDRSRVAHVGDSLHHDVAGASAAGIPSVFVTSGIHASELGVQFGETPSMSALEDLFRMNGNIIPTHVVPALYW